MSEILIGGIEGGATSSHAVIMNSDGKIIGQTSGLGTNHHLLGMKECQKRIAELVEKSKKAAGITTETKLHALGLSLSGCEQEESNQELARGLKETYPNLAEKYIVSSDTEGSVAATSNRGGVTCIAGTGSNTLLINPDGTKAQCGGWGYMLGDEGSAFKISWQAIKYCFDDLDNLSKSPYPIDKVWNLVKEYFKITKQVEILDSIYQNFDKARISSLCKELSNLAKSGDKLSQFVFEKAGEDLARHIAAVYPKASPDLTQAEGGLHILCVGSVWLSWDLLMTGFIGWLKQNTSIEKLSLLRLTTDLGVGAAYLASDRLNLPLKRDYSKNYKVLFRYDKNKLSSNGCS